MINFIKTELKAELTKQNDTISCQYCNNIFKAKSEKSKHENTYDKVPIKSESRDSDDDIINNSNIEIKLMV